MILNVGSAHHGSAVTNPTRIHEDAGLIPGPGIPHAAGLPKNK